MKKIVISNYNFYHTPYQVESLTRYLNRIQVNYITAVNPLRIKQACPTFPKRNIRELFYRYMIPRLYAKYLTNGKKINRKCEMDYTHRVGNIIKRTTFNKNDIFHSFNGCALDGILEAQKKGITTIVECGVHPAFYNQVCIEESQIIKCEPVLFDEGYVEQTEQELIQADYILTLSDICKRSFIQNGIEEKKIKCLPISVDTNLFYRTKKRRDRFTILYVGRITYMKGVQYLLDAYDSLKNEKYEMTLVLAGTITDDYMREKCVKYLTDENVVFKGQVGYDVLRDLYSEASVVVIPSLVDSFCMAVYESFACKTPVITTNNVGAPVTNGINGYKVPIKNAELLAKKMIFFYENREKVEEFGLNGYQRVKENTWEEYSKQLLDFYENCTEMSK